MSSSRRRCLSSRVIFGMAMARTVITGKANITGLTAITTGTTGTAREMKNMAGAADMKAAESMGITSITATMKAMGSLIGMDLMKAKKTMIRTDMTENPKHMSPKSQTLKIKPMRSERSLEKRHHGGPRGEFEHVHDGSLISLFHQCMHLIHHSDGRRSSQNRLLSILAEEKELSQKEMQERMRIQPGSMSELVTKLESKGLLTRVRDTSDKRKISLKITPEGNQAVNAAFKEKERKDPFAALTEEEQESLRRLLTKILENAE